MFIHMWVRYNGFGLFWYKTCAYICAYDTTGLDCFDLSWVGYFCMSKDGEMDQVSVRYV